MAEPAANTVIHSEYTERFEREREEYEHEHYRH